MPSTPKLSLVQLESNFQTAEVPFNEFLLAVDVFTGLKIIDRDLTAPPGSPTDGDAYIVATGGTGDFAGQDGDVAYYFAGWRFVTPWEGLIARIADEDLLVQYDGASWFTVTNDTKQASTRLDSPLNNDQTPLMYTAKAITITEVRSIVVGTGSPSTTWNLMHASSRNSLGTQVFSSDQTTTNESTGDVDNSGFGDETIPAGRFVWLEIESAPTDTDAIEWYVSYTEDAV